MSTREKHDTHQKALALNLDTAIFGSFAEIRAGKEVARWFLRVLEASVTLAKTIYAYDKEVSDRLYGSGTRYVSRPRLQSMLDREWDQLLRQLLASCQPPISFDLAACGDSEVGPRRLRTVAQTASRAAPPDVEALSTVCLRR